MNEEEDMEEQQESLKREEIKQKESQREKKRESKEQIKTIILIVQYRINLKEYKLFRFLGWFEQFLIKYCYYHMWWCVMNMYMSTFSH